MIADLVRECYATYETKDRQGLEKLIADDFSFSSPQDGHIDRAAYFERCWPNSEKVRTITIEKLFEVDVYFGRTLKEAPSDDTKPG